MKTAKAVVEKTKSVWDWKGKPSVMADDRTHERSKNATKGRTLNDPLPAHLQIYKVKK